MPLPFLDRIADNHAMRSALAYFLKIGVDTVAQGLELRPVTGPVKNSPVLVAAILAIPFIGAALNMPAVGFMLAVAVLLLQWNRSLLWHRALLVRKDVSPGRTPLRL